MSKKNNLYFFLLVFSSGFLIFYLIPFIFSFIYIFFDNPVNFSFIGLNNIKELLQNKFFINGLKNTLILMIISIFINFLLSILFSSVIKDLKFYRNIFGFIFLIPLVLPSSTVAFFWKAFFNVYGPLNKFLNIFGIENIDWFQSKYSKLMVIIIFIWKTMGYNIILFLSGFSNIPKYYYEYSKIIGAKKIQSFFYITLPSITPTIFLVIIMSIVNFFKIFREIYLITGAYPNENIYLIQHFMNGLFLSANYSKLVTSSYFLTFFILVIIFILFKIENKIYEKNK